MIRLLPDHIANQIAAGEVVQRPASAVKELLENAVDAGADTVSVVAKGAGRTSLQVVDNGSGMSPTDARMAFERHTTSKIQTLEDLNAIRTFGFRGEALASIAAVSEVEVKTRQRGDEVGTQIIINASKVEKQQPVACPKGTSITVRNLFYNVPARRKFLKSDTAELRHIITEFQRVALCHPEVAMKLIHNNTTLYDFPVSNIRQRVVNMMGKEANHQLIDVRVQTSLGNIKGFIGKPDCAKRTPGDQFFFVNNRYFRSPYFQKAVVNAYEQLLPDKTLPMFFIYFEVLPDKIDINIHPAKIEVKFENEHVIFQMLNATVRESLGKFAIAPSLDFDQEGAPEIPILRKGTIPNTPQVNVDHTFNPFTNERKHSSPSPHNWKKLYDGLPEHSNAFDSTPKEVIPEQTSMADNFTNERTCIQLKGRYLTTTVKSGLMIIDICRAQQRIFYERFLNSLENHSHETQQEIFPQTITLNSADYAIIESMLEDLKLLGYDIRPFGNNSFVLNGQPIKTASVEIKKMFDLFLSEWHEQGNNLKEQREKRIASSLAKAAGHFSETLHRLQALALIDALFACQQPTITPDGKPTLSIITTDEIDKRFLK